MIFLMSKPTASYALSVCLRLVAVYACTSYINAILRSTELIQLTGRHLIEPAKVGVPSGLILLTALAAFWYLVVARWQEGSLKTSLKQKLIALVVLTGFSILLFYAYHPGEQFIASLRALEAQHPMWMTLYAVVLLCLHFVLAPLLVALFFPWKNLRGSLIRFTGIFAITALAPLSIIVDALYYPFSIRIITYGVYGLLSLVPGQVTMHLASYSLAYNGFSVHIGPACIGLQSMTLFSILYFLLCVKISRRRSLHVSKAIGAYIVGILLLVATNIIRIATLITVGSVNEPLAMDLFHPTLAAIILFVLFLVYVKFVSRYLIRK